MKKRCHAIRLLLAILTATATIPASASDAGGDTLSHIGFAVYGGPAQQIAMDQYERKWLRDKQQYVIGAEVTMTAHPSDGDAFARDYNYPTLSAGIKYSFNHGVTMRRTEDPTWGKAQMVDYDSRLGNILTLYGSFARPLIRRSRWQLDYVFRIGVGYNTTQYHPDNNVDNELIGSPLSIYFGAGLQAAYRFTNECALMAGLFYGHHSNGALARPNKGENHIGPLIGLRYTPPASNDKHNSNRQGETSDINHQPSAIRLQTSTFTPYWYLMFRAGLGGKTLLEDWQLTQFQTEPGDPDYRTDRFHLYAAYSMQCDIMRRYARRWASGIGFDLFYGTYDGRVQQLEDQHTFVPAGTTPEKVSPWSMGIAGKHEVYYHNLSLDMALGFYLYRHMGSHAKEIEKPYYERIGLFYSFPRLGGLRIGASVKAHLTKADLTELIVSYPIRL